MSVGTIGAVLVGLSLVAIAWLRDGPSKPYEDDAEPMSWRRPRDVVVIALAIAGLALGSAWMAGWKASI